MDPALPDYLRLLSSIISAESLADLRSIIPAFLVDEIADAASLRGMSLTLSDESKRLPGFVLGLQLAPDDASDLVFRLQRRLRIERDRQVLKAAAERYRAQMADSTKTSTPATGSDLVLAGLLSEQRDPLWSRYRFDDGVVSPTAPIELRDFDRPSYVTAHGEHKLQYLLPPFTVDDVNYRLTEDERSSVSASDLEQDKYRTTSGYVGGTLWIGNDAEVLANWLDRLSSAGARVAYDSVVARMEGIGGAKFALFVQPREFLEAGQLHPDPRVNRETRRFLMDFRHYRAMMVTIGANDHEREIDVAGTLLGH